MTSTTRRLIRQQHTGAIPIVPPPIPGVTLPAPRQPQWGRALALSFLGVVALLTALAIWRLPAARPAEVAPVAPAASTDVQIVTRTPGPSVILYRDILAATPDAVRWHNYTLMCRGKVYEFQGLDALRAWQFQSEYTPADCKCFLPRFEGAGYRECEKE